MTIADAGLALSDIHTLAGMEEEDDVLSPEGDTVEGIEEEEEVKEEGGGMEDMDEEDEEEY